MNEIVQCIEFTRCQAIYGRTRLYEASKRQSGNESKCGRFLLQARVHEKHLGGLELSIEIGHHLLQPSGKCSGAS